MLTLGYLSIDCDDQAWKHLRAGQEHQEQFGERYAAAELARAEALLINRSGASTAQVVNCLDDAGRIARIQGAKLLELRVACDRFRVHFNDEPAQQTSRVALEKIFTQLSGNATFPDLADASKLLDQ